jgi:hypothetical protein
LLLLSLFCPGGAERLEDLMYSKYPLLACMVLALGVVSPASATVINTYTSLAAWSAVTAMGFTTIPFSSASYGSSLSLLGATFTTDGIQALQVLDTTGNAFWGYGTGFAINVVAPSNAVPTIHVTLTTPVTSFGLNLTTVGPYNDPLTVTANGVSYSIPSFSPTGGGFAFFGATFDAPITSFDITGTTNAYLFADNISFGTSTDPGSGGGTDPSPTPEVATLLMIGTGLISMRMMNKRMHLFGA